MPAPRLLDVFLLPVLVEPEQLASKTVVVVDVLRATTTIVHALAAGASQVLPCQEVDEAKELAKQFGEPAVLGGERAGGKVAGFDLGNSPLEYTAATVGGKTLVFTTTNGTRALARCRLARRVLIGAFVNLSAVCDELTATDEIAIVCAGTDGQVTREDALFAGAVADELSKTAPWTFNDQAEIVRDAWQAATADLTTDPLNRLLRSTRGGRNLIGIGHENDIDLAAQIDRFDLVPELDLATWRIRTP